MSDSMSSSGSVWYQSSSHSSAATIPHSLLTTPHKVLPAHNTNDTVTSTPIHKQLNDLSPLCASPLTSLPQWPGLTSHLTTSPLLPLQPTLNHTPAKSAHSILCSPFRSQLQRTASNLFVSPSRHNPFINHTHLRRTESRARDGQPLLRLDATSPAPAPSGMSMMCDIRQKELEELAAARQHTALPQHTHHTHADTSDRDTVHRTSVHSTSHHKPRRAESNVKRPLFTDTNENTSDNVQIQLSPAHKKARLSAVEPSLPSLQSLSTLLQPITPTNRLAHLQHEQLHSGSHDSQHSTHTSGSSHTRASGGSKRTVLFQQYSGSGRVRQNADTPARANADNVQTNAVAACNTPSSASDAATTSLPVTAPLAVVLSSVPTASVPAEKVTHCNCSKTLCIKLYCQCFANSRQCTAACACKDCCNDGVEEHAAIHSHARQQLMERDPTVFTLPRPERHRHTDVQILTDTLTGKQYLSRPCHCKKTQCIKKYCDCFVAGVECSDKCTCHDCHNGHVHSAHTAQRSSTQSSNAKQTHTHTSKSVTDPHELARLQLRMQLQQTGVLSK